MDPSGNDNLDLATVNGMMNLCEAKEQAKLDEAAAITEPEKRREAYARRLREFYAREGVTMSEETIQKSVDEYLENEMAFQPPRGGLAGLFAVLFVYRLLVTALMVVVVFVTLFSGLVVLTIQDQSRKTAYEAATSVTVAIDGDINTTQDAVTSGEQAQQVNTKDRNDQFAAKTLPELLRNPQGELDQDILKNLTAADHALTLANEEASGYRSQLAGVKGYHSKGIAEWNQLQGEAGTAKDKIEAQLAIAKTALTAVGGIQSTQTALDGLGRLWQSLNDQVANAPPKWKSAAQASLADAANRLAQGDTSADNSLQQARKLIADGTRWGSIAIQGQTVLDASHNCQAKDDAAQQALSSAQTAIQEALNEQDLAGAEKSLGQLKNTVAQINQHYLVRIVCRTGYRSVVERTESKSRGKRYYAIVESVDHDGDPTQRRIQNRESGTFLETSMWGQEIPKELYDALYQEKKTTGAIQDLSFGEKEAGYLEPQFSKAPGSNHEITKW